MDCVVNVGFILKLNSVFRVSRWPVRVTLTGPTGYSLRPRQWGNKVEPRATC